MIHTNYFPPRCFCLDSAPPPRQVLQHLAGLLKQNILSEWMLLLLFSLDTIWHLDTIWPRCTPGPWSTSTRCSASDGGYLRRQKANGQLENTAGSPSQRLAQQGPARMPTHYLRCGDLRSPGVTRRRDDPCTRTTWRWWCYSNKCSMKG